MPDNSGSNVDKTRVRMSLQHLYEKNRKILAAADTPIGEMDDKRVKEAIAGFTQTAGVVISCLDEVAKLHAFAAAAILPFKLVMSLTLSYYDNNQKVVALCLQMQCTMCTLFQLRDIEDITSVGPDGQDMLTALMERIGEDIRECGSACDAYLGKQKYKRMLKSKKYEARFTALAQKFMEYRDNLNDIFTQYIARGIATANEKLDKLENTAQTIKAQLEDLFCALRPTTESKLLKLIDEFGGETRCLSSDEFLKALRRNSRELLPDFDEGNRKWDDLAGLRRDLGKEIAENVDVLIKNNMEVFKAKLELQGHQLVKIEAQGDYIITLLLEGAYKGIQHRDLQNLWRTMAWKGSVKARHFVLSLRDYYADHFSATAVSGSNFEIGPPTLEQYAIEIGLSTASDQWALEYIGPKNMRAIIEAIDEDGTGFITTKEANAFAKERPGYWTLLQWLAFWGEGWHSTLPIYQEGIYAIIQTMHKKLDSLCKDNYQFAVWYLDNDVFSMIERLLRSTKHPGSMTVAPELQQLTKEYMDLEENRLRHNLEAIKYVINNSATVTLVTGQGRIEKFIYPLLFLVLKRHLRVFVYATEHIVSEAEFRSLTSSLDFIFQLVLQRISDIQTTLRHVRHNTNASLNDFSFGMFSLLSSSGNTADCKSSTLLSRNTSSEGHRTESNSECLPVFTTDPHLDTLHFQWPAVLLPQPIEDLFPEDKPGGFWAGYLRRGSTTGMVYGGLLQIHLGCFPKPGQNSHLGDEISGYGIGLFGIFSVKGRYRSNLDGITEIDLIAMSSAGGGFPYRLIGTLEPSTQELSGVYVPQSSHPLLEKGESRWFELPSNADHDCAFCFQRTSGEVYRYRCDDGGPSKKSERSAHARWSFLKNALTFYVRRRMWSWQKIKSWGEERREYMGLSGRRYLLDIGYALDPPFSDEEWNRVRELELILTPVHLYSYWELVQWSQGRRDYFCYCSNCDVRITANRYTCPSCTPTDLHDTADLCLNCINKTFQFRSDTEHTSLHDLVELGLFIPAHRLAQIFSKAEDLSSHLKHIVHKSLGEGDGDSGAKAQFSGGGEKRVLKIAGLPCMACQNSVFLPFWACLACETLTAFCNDCHGKEILSTSLREGHEISHHLLLIRNLAPESGLLEMTHPTTRKMDALEAAIREQALMVSKRFDITEDRFTALESRLANVENQIQEHGDLLRRIVNLLEDPGLGGTKSTF